MPKKPIGQQILLGLGIVIVLGLILNQVGESKSSSESQTFKNAMKSIALPFAEVGHYETTSVSFSKGNLLQVNSDFRMKHVQILTVENKDRFIPRVKTQLAAAVKSASEKLGRQIEWSVEEVLSAHDGRAVIKIEATCPSQPLTFSEFWQSI